MTERTIEVHDDPGAAARACAAHLAQALRDGLARRSRGALALSGGRSAPLLLDLLARHDLRWDLIDLYQVDERIAPDGDPARNAGVLLAAFGALPARLHCYEVSDPDLRGALERYSRSLPDRFDAIHLGLGADGHCASLVPGDAVLDARGVAVAPSADPYEGHRRVTLTYDGLARTERIVWLVVGADKRDALSALVRDDPTIPASLVRGGTQRIVCDTAAAPLA